MLSLPWRRIGRWSNISEVHLWSGPCGGLTAQMVTKLTKRYSKNLTRQIPVQKLVHPGLTGYFTKLSMLSMAGWKK